jgi:hypothetical protein
VREAVPLPSEPQALGDSDLGLLDQLGSGAINLLPSTPVSPLSSSGKPLGAVVPYNVPDDFTQATGITPDQYNTFRGFLAQHESQSYAEPPNPGGFMGRYQMGSNEIKESATRLGQPVPSQSDFLSNPYLQEQLFENYTLAHHNQLMNQPAYANADPVTRMALLAGAHLGGPGAISQVVSGTGDPDDGGPSKVGTHVSSYVNGMYNTAGGNGQLVTAGGRGGPGGSQSPLLLASATTGTPSASANPLNETEQSQLDQLGSGNALLGPRPGMTARTPDQILQDPGGSQVTSTPEALGIPKNASLVDMQAIAQRMQRNAVSGIPNSATDQAIVDNFSKGLGTYVVNGQPELHITPGGLLDPKRQAYQEDLNQQVKSQYDIVTPIIYDKQTGAQVPVPMTKQHFLKYFENSGYLPSGPQPTPPPGVQPAPAAPAPAPAAGAMALPGALGPGLGAPVAPPPVLPRAVPTPPIAAGPPVSGVPAAAAPGVVSSPTQPVWDPATGAFRQVPRPSMPTSTIGAPGPAAAIAPPAVSPLGPPPVTPGVATSNPLVAALAGAPVTGGQPPVAPATVIPRPVPMMPPTGVAPAAAPITPPIAPPIARPAVAPPVALPNIPGIRPQPGVPGAFQGAAAGAPLPPPLPPPAPARDIGAAMGATTPLSPQTLSILGNLNARAPAAAAPPPAVAAPSPAVAAPSPAAVAPVPAAAEPRFRLGGVPTLPPDYTAAQSEVANLKDKAAIAQNQLTTIGDIRDLMKSVTPGNYAPLKEELGRKLIGLGMNPDTVNRQLGNVSDAQSLVKAFWNLGTTTVVGNLGPGQAASTLETGLQANPNIALEPGAIDLMTNILAQQARANQAKYNAASQAFTSPPAGGAYGAGGMYGAVLNAETGVSQRYSGDNILHSAQLMTKGKHTDAWNAPGSLDANGNPTPQSQGYIDLIPPGASFYSKNGGELRKDASGTPVPTGR